MSDIRMAKYETFIEDIDSNLKKYRDLLWLYGEGNRALKLIYDYDKCNDYAKVIIDRASIKLVLPDSGNYDFWKVSTDEEVGDEKKAIFLTKQFVKLCRGYGDNFDEGYKFIFWALMILTVDKTDAEEHLALICDFAKMLRITEDEFEDIIQIIKINYNEAPIEYTFKSDKVRRVLGYLRNMYEW